VTLPPGGLDALLYKQPLVNFGKGFKIFNAVQMYKVRGLSKKVRWKQICFSTRY